MLKPKQIVALVLLAAGLWLLVTLNIRLRPASLTDPVRGTIAFLLAFPGAWLSVLLASWVGRLSAQQLLPGVSVVGAAAMMLDGAALRWFAPIYGNDDTTLRLGAAWLLWGYGAALAVALVMTARRGTARPLRPAT